MCQARFPESLSEIVFGNSEEKSLPFFQVFPGRHFSTSNGSFRSIVDIVCRARWAGGKMSRVWWPQTQSFRSFSTWKDFTPGEITGEPPYGIWWNLVQHLNANSWTVQQSLREIVFKKTEQFRFQEKLVEFLLCDGLFGWLFWTWSEMLSVREKGLGALI